MLCSCGSTAKSGNSKSDSMNIVSDDSENPVALDTSESEVSSSDRSSAREQDSKVLIQNDENYYLDGHFESEFFSFDADESCWFYNISQYSDGSNGAYADMQSQTAGQGFFKVSVHYADECEDFKGFCDFYRSVFCNFDTNPLLSEEEITFNNRKAHKFILKYYRYIFVDCGERIAFIWYAGDDKETEKILDTLVIKF